jgi:hypothetical protein
MTPVERFPMNWSGPPGITAGLGEVAPTMVPQSPFQKASPTFVGSPVWVVLSLP